MVFYILLLFIGIVLGVLAQLSLKQGIVQADLANSRHEGVGAIIKRVFWNSKVVAGFVAYGISSLLWLVVLSRLDLSYAYPMIASSYFFVALGSMWLFEEHITPKRWLSIVIIMVGVALVSIS